MEKYELMQKVFALDSQRMELENRVSNLNSEILMTLEQMRALDISKEGVISEETQLVLNTFGFQVEDNKLIEKEKGMTYNEYKEIQKDILNNQENAEKNVPVSNIKNTSLAEPQQMHYRGYAYVKGQQKPHILHANTPDEIIMRLQNWNKARTEDLQFKVVNIGSLDNQQNKYTDYHKYEVATGKDISSVYLQIPKMEKEEFLHTIEYLKENGAKYLPNQKKWYITADMDTELFKDYLPDKNAMQVANTQPENTKEYSLLLSKDVEANECMVAFHDGRETITLHGDQFGVNFAQFKTPDEVVEIVDDYIKKQMAEIKEEILDLDKLQPGDKLECYVPEYCDDGFREIISMQKFEATIESKGGYQNEIYYFSECSLSDYSTGAAKNTLFSESQANVINRAIASQVYSGAVNVIADSTLSVGQMDVMIAAAKDGFLVPQIMELKSFPAPDMDMMRIGLQNGVDKKVIQEICGKEMSWSEKRQALNGEIKKAETKIGTSFKKEGYPISRETARKVIQLNHCIHQKNTLADIASAFKNQTFKDTNPKAQQLVNDISRECQTVAAVQNQMQIV